MLKVKVENLDHKPNQFIIETDDGIYFQSYSTVVACKHHKDECVYLDTNWDYSNTTTKYLHKLLRTESKREIESRIKEGRYKVINLN